MTEPVKPVSKVEKVTSLEKGKSPSVTSSESSSNISSPNPSFQIPVADVFIKDQTSAFVGPDSFVSGEEVLSASLALFAPETQKKENDLTPAQKTMELTNLDYLLGISSTRVAPKSEGSSAELSKHREEMLALYAAHASGQARLAEKKKKNLWKRISGFLKSIFLNS